MAGVRHRFVGLCLPPLAFAVLDITLTLVGQSAEYWSGSYAQVNEASPTFHQLLAIHPLAFVGGGLGWAAVFVAIILLLPDTMALIVSLAVTFGHTVGSATWLRWHFQYDYQAVNGLLLLSAIVLGLSIRWGWQASPAQEYRLPRLSNFWRWLLIAALFAIGIYLFLWPRRA